MDLAVDLPVLEMRLARMAEKEGAFERGIVALDHGKAVEAQDVAGFQRPRGDGVVRAVGVEP